MIHGHRYIINMLYEERFGRMVKETARIENLLLEYVETALFAMSYLGYALMASGYVLITRYFMVNSRE